MKNYRADITCVAVAACFAPSCCPPAAVRQLLIISPEPPRPPPPSIPHNFNPPFPLNLPSASQYTLTTPPSSPWCLSLTSNHQLLPLVSHPKGSPRRAPHRVRRESTLQAQPDSRIRGGSADPKPCRRSVVGPGFHCDILAKLGKATGDLQQQQQPQKQQEEKEGAGAGEGATHL